MKALTTLEIDRILKQNPVTRNNFIGTFPACIIPNVKKQMYSFVSNTHAHDRPGEHWNSWVINGETVIFFDSFGRNVYDPMLPEYYRDFVKTFKYVKCNTVQIQDLDSIACGYFCIHFIYLASLGFNFKHFLSDYSTDLKANDYVVFNIINLLK